MSTIQKSAPVKDNPLQKVEVSVYQNIFSKNSKSKNLVSILEEIKNSTPRFKAEIAGIRELTHEINELNKYKLIDEYEGIFKSKTETKNKLKNNLPSVVFQGLFNERNDNSIVEASGILILDFDKFENDEILLEAKAQIIADKSVLFCFVSPSGNGLKVGVKIPKVTTAQEYKIYFQTYQKSISKNEILQKHFDKSVSNISRVTFLSTDVNIYINYKAISLKADTSLVEVLPIKDNFNPIKNIQSDFVTDEMRIDYVVNTITKGGNPDSEGRNNFVLNKACQVFKYGLSFGSAINYFNKYSQKDFSQKEILRCVKNAHERSRHEAVFNDEIAFKNIVSNPIIKKKNESIEANTQNKNNYPFWSRKETARGGIKIEVDPIALLEYINKLGFYRVKLNEVSTFIKLENNIVTEVSIPDIKTEVFNEVEAYDDYEFTKVFVKDRANFSADRLDFLKSKEINFIRDSEYKVYKPFINGVVEITKEGIKLIPYESLNGVFWGTQIIQRHFDIVEVKDSFMWVDFINKLSNNEPKRNLSIRSSLGYLSSNFKNSSKAKLIVFTDNDISDEADGGGGKSLIVGSLKNHSSFVVEDGKRLSGSDDRFKFQKVGLSHSVLAIEDIKRNFDFQEYYNMITGDFEVQKKGRDSFIIPFETSPKIVMTSNFPLNDSSNSTLRRRIEVSIYQYFNVKREPIDIYKRRFFDEWNVSEWNIYDNYSMENIRLFLSEGISKIEVENTGAKEFIISTDRYFHNFIEDGEFQFDSNFKIIDVVNSYNEYSGQRVVNRIMTKWIDALCVYKKYRKTDAGYRRFKLVKI